jgi:hypothetical protein
MDILTSPPVVIGAVIIGVTALCVAIAVVARRN